jgi:hypothetical protein
LKKWKKPKKFQRMMVRSGYKSEEADRVWVKMNKWQSVIRKRSPVCNGPRMVQDARADISQRLHEEAL